jgi:HAD superfamily hydrolase (TIGR01509 family)
MVKAILFDFDGTIVDSLPHIHPAWKKAFIDQGKEVSDEEIIRHVYYTNKAYRAERYSVDGDKLHEDYYKYTQPFYDQYVAHEHVDAVLKELKERGIKTAIVSFSNPEKIRAVFERLGFLEYFDVILGGADVENRKPHPEIAFKAMERLGVTPDETILIGDAPVDMETAKNAGIKKGLYEPEGNAPYTHRELFETHVPDFTFKHYSELLAKIDQL